MITVPMGERNRSDVAHWESQTIRVPLEYVFLGASVEEQGAAHAAFCGHLGI